MPTDDVDSELLLEPLKRVQALERLLEGPATRGELQDELDVSRATLHRVATFLEDEEMAEEADDGLSLTTVGHEVANAAVEYEERVGTARQLAPLLNEFDLEALPVPLDPEVLSDADVVRPKPGQPGRPAQQVVDAVDGAERIRGLAPVVIPIYVEAYHREILDGTEVELVFAPDVIEGLEETYIDKFGEALETGRLDVSVTEEVPLGLYITPEKVGIAGYDADDVLQIVVESRSEAVREWAEAVFEAYRVEATPL
jgi:predicted transcriptional regulator